MQYLLDVLGLKILSVSELCFWCVRRGDRSQLVSVPLTLAPELDNVQTYQNRKGTQNERGSDPCAIQNPIS